MGRTITKYREFDDEDRSRKTSKPVKHSKNFPGHGMRVINKWSEEKADLDDYDYDDTLNDEFDENDEKHFANTSHTQRTLKGNKNGY